MDLSNNLWIPSTRLQKTLLQAGACSAAAAALHQAQQRELSALWGCPQGGHQARCTLHCRSWFRLHPQPVLPHACLLRGFHARRCYLLTSKMSLQTIKTIPRQTNSQALSGQKSTRTPWTMEKKLGKEREGKAQILIQERTTWDQTFPKG